MGLGSQIRRRRKAIGWSDRVKFAKAAGVSADTLRKVERDDKTTRESSWRSVLDFLEEREIEAKKNGGTDPLCQTSEEISSGPSEASHERARAGVFTVDAKLFSELEGLADQFASVVERIEKSGIAGETGSTREPAATHRKAGRKNDR